MQGRLTAPPSFRRLASALAGALVVAEIVLFALAWRLGTLLEPADPPAARAFVVFGTVLTLQAMGVVGAAWLIVAVSRTVLDWDDHGVRLEHPWRQWSGDWMDVNRLAWRAGWLVVTVRGQWRRWYVRVPDADAPDLMTVREAIRTAQAQAATTDANRQPET